MKFLTSTYIPIDIEEEVRGDSVLAELWPRRGSDMVLPWPSSAFDRLMTIAATARIGMRTSARPELNEQDQREVSLWEMHLDSHCSTNAADERWRAGTWDSLQFVPGTNKVKRFDAYRISRLRMKASRVTGPGGVFLFPTAVRENLRTAGLDDGAGWGTVCSLDGTPVADAKLLVPEHLLGPLVANHTMERMTGPDEQEFLAPRAWTLVLPTEAVETAKPFNLTTEPTAGYNLGSVVVQDAVRNFLEGAGVSGVFYTPVLDAASETCRRLLAAWTRLRDQVMANPLGRLG